MLKSILLLFILISNISFGQLTREYFFDDNLQINDSTSIVLIVEYPQSQFALELGNRIYEDTSFIRYVKENWYFEYDKSKRPSEHRCGFDWNFYSLQGLNLTFLNRLNSKCEQYKLGVKNFNLLKQIGRQLRTEKLTRIGPNINKDELFNENLITAEYENNKEWGYSKTSKYPIIFYDNYFKTEILLDSNLSINENVLHFIKKYTQHIEGVNWNIKNESTSENYEHNLKINNFFKNKTPCTIEIEIYLTEDKINYFKSFDIKKTYFQIKRGHTLILMYKD